MAVPPLKILMLEDDPIDADIVQWALKENFPCTFNVAVNKEAYRDALDKFHPDLILADNALPRFNAREALEMMHEHSLNVPFILVTGTVSEEFAADIIRLGADDYILKDRLARLPAAINSALHKKKSEAAVKHSEEVRRLIMNAALDAIVCIDPNGIITVWNAQAENMFGWKEEEILGKQLAETIIPVHYREAHRKGLSRYLQTGEGPVLNRVIEISALHQSGNEFPIELAIVPIKKSGDDFFCAFIRDITLRKKGEEKLQQSYEEIRRLASHLQNVREEERLIISREIHDQLGQQLTIMKMDINWLKKRSVLAINDATKEKLDELNEMMDETIKTIRKISTDLRPSLLDDLGLGAAIEWHLNEFEKRSGIAVHYTGLNNEVPLSITSKTGLFRIVQESLTNVARYAQAKNVKVNLEKRYDHLWLSIKDDGIGFDLEEVAAKKTLGIVGMRERSAMMGGNYDINSSPGNGTTIVVNLPIVTDEQQPENERYFQ
ncbi:MAG TPA: PAS domain S-box protein [Chitinophagaceae bacterium]|nr:PAS domain S-box protein [Chitinophagaceae bacterium]